MVRMLRKIYRFIKDIQIIFYFFFENVVYVIGWSRIGLFGFWGYIDKVEFCC